MVQFSFKHIALIFHGSFFLATQAIASSDGSGLQVSVAVDGVGTFNVDKESSAKDSLDVREAELTLYAPIDHIFEGTLSLAAHKEGGVSLFEVHEATISSSKLIPLSSFRFGQYFLGIGRLNRFHRHDWPFISAPKVHRSFFGEEGVLDTGGEYSFLVPTSFYLNITAGLTNGWTYGHSHNEGKKPKQPTHYGRVSTFFEPTEDVGISVGANFLSRTSADDKKMTLTGLDGVAKWDGNGYSQFLIQGEIWHRTFLPKQGEKDISMGSYLYSQYGFSKSLFAGCRLDYYTVASLKNAVGEKIDNSEYAIVPTITYKTSEFATFKIAYTNNTSTQARQDDKVSNILEIQSTFILGAHPAHEF